MCFIISRGASSSIHKGRRSRTAAGPVLEFKAGGALEFAFIVGNESESRGYGVSSNPEIVATDHLTASLQRCANLTVGCRRFPRQGNHRQKRYKAPERFQSKCASLASLCAITSRRYFMGSRIKSHRPVCCSRVERLDPHSEPEGR